MNIDLMNVDNFRNLGQTTDCHFPVQSAIFCKFSVLIKMLQFWESVPLEFQLNIRHWMPNYLKPNMEYRYTNHPNFWVYLKQLTCIQCIDKPGPVYNFLWHIWHLKCLAFWCCIRIFSSSNSLLQYLANVKESQLKI